MGDHFRWGYEEGHSSANRTVVFRNLMGRALDVADPPPNPSQKHAYMLGCVVGTVFREAPALLARRVFIDAFDGDSSVPERRQEWHVPELPEHKMAVTLSFFLGRSQKKNFFVNRASGWFVHGLRATQILPWYRRPYPRESPYGAVYTIPHEQLLPHQRDSVALRSPTHDFQEDYSEDEDGNDFPPPLPPARSPRRGVY